jgi:CDGSH-type Zn-finger protein
MTAPVPAQKAPYEVTLQAGRTYFWCACGLSKKQPFCDGSHSVTDITPVKFKAEEEDTVFFCGCKATAGKPFCDGTHNNL